MINVISLDFDYWLEMPISENLDWAFKESPFFLHHIWTIRAMDALARGCDLREICTLPEDEPEPCEFVKMLKRNNIRITKAGLDISESHGYAYVSFSNLEDLHVIHVDAHHDLGYNMDELNCDNWLMGLAKDGKVSKITLIYPKWRLRQANEWDASRERVTAALDKLGVDLEVKYGLEELPHDLTIKRIFLAHSGTWVPPWLDTYFKDLLSTLISSCDNRSIMLFGDITLEKMTDRELNWDEIQSNADTMRQQMDNIRSGITAVAPAQ